MNYDSAIISGLREIEEVRQFQSLFPHAEHAIVQSKRDFEHDGWKLVNEWISRASLYNRYVLWLVVAIDVNLNNVVSALEQPKFYMIEVEKVEKCRDDQAGPKWECNFGQLDYGDWKEIVDAGGDLISLGVDLNVDEPVDRFSEFWRDTRPPPNAPVPDGIVTRAPLRFTS